MSKNSVLMKYAVGYACLLAVGVANAVGEDSSAPVLHMGGVDAFPGIAVTEKSDSNPFRVVGGEKHNVTVISPSMMLKAQKNADVYSLTYKADVGRFSNASADNYVDHSFLGSAAVTLSERAQLSINPEYKIGHDDRGALAVNTGLKNDWHDTGISGVFKYGADESQGRFALDAGYKDHQYQNNRVTTVALDKTTRDIGGTFFYRVMPKTNLLLNVADTRINYKTNTAGNGDELRYMAGVTWYATAQTSGTFKIGQQQKKFDNGTPTFKGSGWDGNVKWSPVEVAHVDFATSRKTYDAAVAGVSSYMLSTNSSLDLGYDLTDRTSLHANGSKASDKFYGTALAGRVDNTTTYGMKADYKILKWLVGGVEYSNAKRSSTDANSTYSRKILGVSLRSEL